MAVIIFTTTQKRLAVRGSCLDSDLRHVVDALEAFGRTTSDLILDLRRVSMMSWSVAESILLAWERMRADRVRVQLLMRPGSAVERMVETVRASAVRDPLTAGCGQQGR
jgi:hypothetical protein